MFRSGGKPPEDTMGLGAKASGAKFICRSQARTLANPSTATSSTAQLGANAGKNFCSFSLSLYLLYIPNVYSYILCAFMHLSWHLFLYVQFIYLSDGTHTPGYHIICIRAYTLTALDVVLSSTSARRGALFSPRYMQNATIYIIYARTKKIS